MRGLDVAPSGITGGRGSRYPDRHCDRGADRICGFDGFQGPGAALRHYSAHNRVDEWTDYHNPHLDARYLRERVAEGRLVVL